MNLLFKLLTDYYSLVSFFKRKVFIRNIKKDDLVLDVGSGDKPFWRADVMVDKYLEDDQQRSTGAMVYDKRKLFIEADVENLPFKNNAFDFVFCAHLLEHVLHPDRAIKELTRVARRGYIEVPSAIGDIFSSFPVHLWYCDYRDNVLIFQQKSNALSFHQEIVKNFGSKINRSPILNYLLVRYTSYYIRVFWKKSVDYKIIRVSNPYKYQYTPHDNYTKTTTENPVFNLYRLFYLVATALYYKKKYITIDSLLKHDKKRN